MTQEPKGSPAQRGQKKRRCPSSRELRGDGEQTQSSDGGDPACQPVHVVDQFHRVGNDKDPHHGEKSRKRTRKGATKGNMDADAIASRKRPRRRTPASNWPSPGMTAERNALSRRAG